MFNANGKGQWKMPMAEYKNGKQFSELWKDFPINSRTSHIPL